jgi:uncharacterized protein
MAFSILSLDGGGSWALLEAMALADLFGADTRGQEILARFDLVAANSGGSLVLAGLASDWTPGRIMQMFLDGTTRNAIFAPLPFWKRLNPMRIAGLGPKYSAAGKLEALNRIMPLAALTLPEVRDQIARERGRSPHFLIIGLDYDRRRAAFFRSNVASSASSSSRPLCPTLAEAAHASTNAPVNYFDGPAELIGRRFWDGAVAGYNNPTLAAVVEALAAEHAPEEVTVLSLGTGSDQRPAQGQGGGAGGGAGLTPPMAVARNNPSLARDVGKMATAILDDPPDAASFIAHVVLKKRGVPTGVEPSPIVRMSPSIRPLFDGTRWHWPACFSPEEWKTILDVEMDATRDSEVALIRRLGEEWLKGNVPNEAIRASSEFKIEIGHATYPEAKRAWPTVLASRGAGDRVLA